LQEASRSGAETRPRRFTRLIELLVVIEDQKPSVDFYLALRLNLAGVYLSHSVNNSSLAASR